MSAYRDKVPSILQLCEAYLQSPQVQFIGKHVERNSTTDSYLVQLAFCPRDSSPLVSDNPEEFCEKMNQFLNDFYGRTDLMSNFMSCFSRSTYFHYNSFANVISSLPCKDVRSEIIATKKVSWNYEFSESASEADHDRFGPYHHDIPIKRSIEMWCLLPETTYFPGFGEDNKRFSIFELNNRKLLRPPPPVVQEKSFLRKLFGK